VQKTYLKEFIIIPQLLFIKRTSSIYDIIFRGVQPKYHSNFKPDIYSSGIKGVVPDPLITGRIKENNDINDNLKTKIKTLLYTGNY
jgi:hypothetical protein